MKRETMQAPLRPVRRRSSSARGGSGRVIQLAADALAKAVLHPAPTERPPIARDSKD